MGTLSTSLVCYFFLVGVQLLQCYISFWSACSYDSAIFLSGRRAGARGIAFSAVVSHNTDVNLGMAVKFNKVLFNDGHGYNPSTGVFMAPIEGVSILQ